MEAANAIVLERERVYLKKLYDSEQYISTVISNMISSDLGFKFPVDFETEPLAPLASDPDQVNLYSSFY